MFNKRDFVKVTDKNDSMFGKIGVVQEFYPLSGSVQVQFPHEAVGLYTYLTWQLEVTQDWV